MNIDELTFGQIKQLSGLLAPVSSDNSHWEVGKNYVIRTVTHIDIGTLTKVTDKEFVLINATWVADTGRFKEFVKTGEINECEPYPDDLPVIVGRGALIDACEWLHALPREQK